MLVVMMLAVDMPEQTRFIVCSSPAVAAGCWSAVQLSCAQDKHDRQWHIGQAQQTDAQGVRARAHVALPVVDSTWQHMTIPGGARASAN